LKEPGRELAAKLLNKRRSISDEGEKIPALHTRRVDFSELADNAILIQKLRFGAFGDTTVLATGAMPTPLWIDMPTTFSETASPETRVNSWSRSFSSASDMALLKSGS
jgi:hypothetical protein